MSLDTRAATCASCGKRLNRKQWYYRNGQYFCKKRCWTTEREKAAEKVSKEAAGPAKAAAQVESGASPPAS